MTVHHAAEVLGIVPAGDDEGVEHGGDDALAGMQARGAFVIAPLVRRRRETDESLVRPAVVSALELQNERFASVRTREAQRGEHDLGGAVIKAHALGSRHEFLQSLGHVDLQFALRGPVRPFACLRGDGVGHSRGRMTIQKSALADLEVEALIAIHIPHARAFATIKIERHGLLHFADAAVHAGGDGFLSTFKELAGAGIAVGGHEG